MTHQLNGINVHEGMYLRARSAKANGSKVFMCMPKGAGVVEASELATEAGIYCENCDGFGRLALEIFVGGPFTEATDKKHVVWHDGAYYTHDIVMFICPDCNGAGVFTRATARWDELQL